MADSGHHLHGAIRRGGVYIYKEVWHWNHIQFTTDVAPLATAACECLVCKVGNPK